MLKNRHVTPLLRDAIYTVLREVIYVNDVPSLFLQYFSSLKGCKNTPELHTVKKSTAKKITNRLVLAAAVGKVVADLVDAVLGSRPDDIVKLLVSVMEKKIENEKKTVPKKSRISAEVTINNIDHVCGDANNVVTTQREREKKQPIIFLVLGIGGSGKSTLISILKGCKNPKCRPSLGFRPVSMIYNSRRVVFYDVGGGEKIRGIWANYYHAVHAVIFVIDSSCSEEDFQETMHVAKITIGHKSIQGKPLLVVSSKIDQGGRSTAIIEKEMNLIINKEGQTQIIEACLLPKCDKFSGEVDPVIEGGVEWLINICLVQFDDLDGRVFILCLFYCQRERERGVLKASICKAFELQGETRRDVFDKTEGEFFLYNELGLTEPEVLPPEGKEVAALVGYQKYALMVIGKMISRNIDMKWNGILLHVKSIIEEITVELQNN